MDRPLHLIQEINNKLLNHIDITAKSKIPQNYYPFKTFHTKIC